jgi:hypothetical protein
MAQVQQLTPAQQVAMQAQKAVAQNMANRNAVLQQAYPMLQGINAQTVQPANQTQINIAPQNVGLIKGFLVRMTATITNPAAGSSVLTRTPQGPANLLQSVVFTDLQNYQRINTSGWHLSMIDSAKQGRPFLSSTPSDSPMGYGSNWNVISAPQTIATNSSANISMYYWVPLAYSETDLTGAIYANVVNATMNLQLNLSTAAQAVVANTADPTLAMYQGAGAVAGVTLTNVAITVYQSYLDQLPTVNGAPILPTMDLNTIYEFKNTSLTGMNVGQDFYIGYSNFRHFLSTTAMFDNQNAGVYPAAGSDVNYWSFRTANYTDTRKADPYTWAALARRKLLTDPPVPVYYFDHRDKPIFTTQTGNTNLVLNPATVNANAQVLVGWEALANVSQLVNAGTLAAST